MIKRPKPGENEEDILKMQEEFLKESNLRPSAQIVNLRKTESKAIKTISNPSDTRKPSRYARSKGLNSVDKFPQKLIKNNMVMGEILEKNTPVPEENIASESDTLLEIDDDYVYFPKVIPSVLGNIIEKNTENFSYNSVSMPSTGFPIARKRSTDTEINTALPSSSNPQPSASKLQKMEIDQPSNMEHESEELNLPRQSFILSSEDATSIHNENIKLLSKMSEKDILEEQQKLLSNMDSNLIEFLGNKRKKSNIEGTGQEKTKINLNKMGKTNEENVERMDTKSLNSADDDSLWENDVLSHPQVNSWLHFNNLEKDKLEWLKGIKESNEEKPNEPYEARFDFKGYLLPYTIEYNEKTKTLFHHGDESHRPGYSVPELFELTRSTIMQQRVIGLNMLAGILEYNSTGAYKDVIDIPLSKIFFIIRIALDENKTIILEPALKGLRNLIYNRIDEASLDALIGFEEGTYQPCLEHDKSEIEDIESNESELKDFHLAEIDIIAALIRTDILQRLYYIIENMKPSFNCVQYSLQILIRLARDSVQTSEKIVQMDHLMSVIIKSFLPTTSINFLFEPNIAFNGKPILAALKLMRILSLQSKEIGDILISKYDLLKPLSTYINSGVDGTYGLRLQIEAYCILNNLLHYELGTENAISLLPIILTTLYKHVQGTDAFISTSVLSITHAAMVMQFIMKLLHSDIENLDNFKEQVYPLLKEGLQKWSSQVRHFDSYTCGHLRLVCSILDCCRNVLEIEKVPFNFLNNSLNNLIHSNGFNIIAKNLISSSNLLSGIEDEDMYIMKNLVCLRSLTVSSTQKVLPILQMCSPVPFLVTLSKLLLHIQDHTLTQVFITHIEDYIRKLTQQPLYLCNNWFTRMEIELVYSVIRLSVNIDISEALKDVIYAVANRLCYILRVDKHKELDYLFRNIIFKKQWFTAERLFNLVSLSESDGFSKALTTIDDIRHCYSTVMNLNNINSRNIVLRDWQEPILPRDWIYLPILSLYSKSQEVKVTPKVHGVHANKVAQTLADEKELTIKCCLEWIVFNETCFPDLLKDIDVTDRFCRIMCVFLCDNSIFLDPKIKILLCKCIQIIFKAKNRLNFDKELVGLHNFQDLYTQFLEQFQSVSYGDPTFSACVLVPIAQRHNIKWRKLLWSEYAGCLRALDCQESLLCYDLNEYLYPEETDESLLRCYYRAMSSNLVRPGTIAYKIAYHHIEKYKARKNM